MASSLVCGAPWVRISTRRGMAPEAVMIGLLTDEADKVIKAAAACSCRIGFSD